MRRWLIVFLLLVVPFQMVWASAAPYCAHEADTGGPRHFGHHEHRHQASGDMTPAFADDGDPPGAYHADCESCHLGCSAAVAVPTVAVQSLARFDAAVFQQRPYASHIPSGPERPDRGGSTSAVRFGGGVVSMLLDIPAH